MTTTTDPYAGADTHEAVEAVWQAEFRATAARLGVTIHAVPLEARMLLSGPCMAAHTRIIEARKSAEGRRRSAANANPDEDSAPTAVRDRHVHQRPGARERDTVEHTPRPRRPRWEPVLVDRDTPTIACVICGETKPGSKFPTASGDPAHREARCRACRDAGHTAPIAPTPPPAPARKAPPAPRKGQPPTKGLQGMLP